MHVHQSVCCVCWTNKVDCSTCFLRATTSERFELYFLTTYMFSSEGTWLLFDT